MENEKRTIASETIADLSKKLNMVRSDVEHICDDVHQARAIFSAIQYAVNEGLPVDTDACMAGFSKMLESMQNNAENVYRVCDTYVMEENVI